MTVKVYNADEVTIILGPALVDSGYADGEFLRIEREAEDTNDVVGTDGEVTVGRSNDRRATVTFILMQSADANGILSVLSNLTRDSPGMAGAIHPLFIKDRNSGVGLYTAQNAWVAAPPDLTFDRTATAREWVIRVAKSVRVDAGNNNGG